MNAYLEKGADFTDFELLERPTSGYAADKQFLCPVCKGHGGWNLKLHAYGEGKHFRASCSQCNGWGWVDEADRDCEHERVELSQKTCKERGIHHYGMFCHVYECTKCGKIASYDSSG